MSYTLRLLTEASRDLVVDALLSEGDKRTRVAQGLARHVAEDKANGTDVRSPAVRVTMLLAEAGQLIDLARELRDAVDVPLVTRPDSVPMGVVRREPAVTLTADDVAEKLTTGAVTVEDLTPDPDSDDGLSPAAHAAAELAGLEDTLLDEDGEDVITGATAEDDTDDVEQVLR